MASFTCKGMGGLSMVCFGDAMRRCCALGCGLWDPTALIRLTHSMYISQGLAEYGKLCSECFSYPAFSMSSRSRVASNGPVALACNGCLAGRLQR